MKVSVMNDSQKIILPGRRRGCITVPSSKSIAHREIIAAALSAVEGPIVRGESNDTLATRACLRAMMAGENVWPCGESGSTLRFFIPIAMCFCQNLEFCGKGRLRILWIFYLLSW